MGERSSHGDSKITGRHLVTAERILSHPAGHNIEWRDAAALLAELDAIAEESNGRFLVTLGGESEVFDRSARQGPRRPAGGRPAPDAPRRRHHLGHPARLGPTLHLARLPISSWPLSRATSRRAASRNATLAAKSGPAGEIGSPTTTRMRAAPRPARPRRQDLPRPAHADGHDAGAALDGRVEGPEVEGPNPDGPAEGALRERRRADRPRARRRRARRRRFPDAAGRAGRRRFRNGARSGRARWFGRSPRSRRRPAAPETAAKRARASMKLEVVGDDHVGGAVAGERAVHLQRGPQQSARAAHRKSPPGGAARTPTGAHETARPRAPRAPGSVTAYNPYSSVPGACQVRRSDARDARPAESRELHDRGRRAAGQTSASRASPVALRRTFPLAVRRMAPGATMNDLVGDEAEQFVADVGRLDL